MAKKIVGLIKLQVPAGKANPSPPIGPALGQRGLNIMEFCKAFNAQTQSETGTVIPVVITVYEDRSFTFVTKTPPTAVLIREAAGLPKGATNPGKELAGSISKAKVTEIATIKLPDLNAYDLAAAELQVAGTARSMGIEIV